MSRFAIQELFPLTDGTTVDLRPQWNVDGRTIVFERRTATGSMLLRAHLRGSRLSEVEPLDLCNRDATLAQGRAAFFGHDDFAFVSNRSGSPAVWRADLGKGLLEQLTLPFADESDHGPTARPDSDGHFAFFRIVGAGRPHLFVGRLGETNQPLATGRSDGDQPWFMPGAGTLVFHSVRDGDHGMFERDVDGPAPARRLAPTDEATAFVTPFPSPDGRHVVFASAATGVSQIYVMAIDGSDRQQLTFDPQPACFPAWAPHGDDIVFARGEPQRPAGGLFVMRLRRVSEGAQPARTDAAAVASQ